MSASAINNQLEGRWSCAICLQLKDGIESDQNGGDVSISEKCCHTFHNVCVQKWIDGVGAQHRKCPLCRDLLGRAVIIPAPEFVEQCLACKEDPQGYTLREAFFRRYNCYPESKPGFIDEDITRPEALRGKGFNPEITSETKLRYFHECIDRGYTQEEIVASGHLVMDDVHKRLDQKEIYEKECTTILSVLCVICIVGYVFKCVMKQKTPA